MPRPSGSTAIVGDLRKQAILAYKADNPNAGYGTIAKAVGVSRSYVQQVLTARLAAPRSVSLAKIQEDAIAYRRAAIEACEVVPGAFSTVSYLLSLGYKAEDLPAFATIERWFAADETLKVERLSLGNKHRYWSEPKPSCHGDLSLIDTATVKIAGVTYTLLLANDWYSRVAHCDIVSKNFVKFVPGFLGQFFAVCGCVHRVVQSDNGMGFFSTGYRWSYTAAQRFAFQQGVKEWRFVPVAEANRNAKVERLVYTVKDKLERQSFASLEEARIWLHSWMRNFNVERHHMGLSTSRSVTGMRTPAQVGTYIELPLAAPRVLKVGADVPLGSKVVYKRLVMSGVVVVNAPEMVFFVGDSLTGHYLDIELVHLQQGGTIYFPTAEGRLQIGTFDEVGRRIYCQMDKDSMAGIAPYNFDEFRYQLAQAKHLKDRKPIPGYVAPGILKELLPSGYFRLVDEETGECLYDSLTCLDVDHYVDFAQ